MLSKCSSLEDMEVVPSSTPASPDLLYLCMWVCHPGGLALVGTPGQCLPFIGLMPISYLFSTGGVDSEPRVFITHLAISQGLETGSDVLTCMQAALAAVEGVTGTLPHTPDPASPFSDPGTLTKAEFPGAMQTLGWAFKCFYPQRRLQVSSLLLLFWLG